MKKLFTLLLFAVCCIAGYAQAVIDPLLSEEMTRRSDDEKIKVIVIMKSQYDRAEMNRRADYYVNRSERREFVVNELKAFAYASQYDLRHSLAEMQRNDMTTEPVVLWMANALYFDATKAAIQDLASILQQAMEHTVGNTASGSKRFNLKFVLHWSKASGSHFVPQFLLI